MELRWWFCNSRDFQIFPQYMYNYKVASLQRSDRTRGGGHKLKYLRNFFYCDGGQTLEQVAQRPCGVFILGNTKNLSGYGLNNLLWFTLLSAEGRPKTSSGPFQSQPICYSVVVRKACSNPF